LCNQLKRKVKEKHRKRTRTSFYYSSIAALITMPIEDAEKFVRKEPLEEFYDVGNELGR
jgi:hypothetical protein